MREDIKLNNLIFPIWMMWILPPVALVALIGNFIIDSIVILLAFWLFKVVNSTGRTIGQLYKKTILKVWVFGFLSDIIGAIILFVISLCTGSNNELLEAISYDPFMSLSSFLIVFGAMLVAGYMIYVFNYYIVFNKIITEKKIRFKVALTIAIVTIPWTYLIPTKLMPYFR